MDIRENQLQWYTSFLIKKSAGSGVTTLADKSMSNQLQRTNELHEPIIRKF